VIPCPQEDFQVLLSGIVDETKGTMFRLFISVAAFHGASVQAQLSSNGERERNGCCLLKLEGVGLLTQNVKKNGLYTGPFFISHGPQIC
jgi:hypothetical protein